MKIIMAKGLQLFQTQEKTRNKNTKLDVSNYGGSTRETLEKSSESCGIFTLVKEIHHPSLGVAWITSST